MATTDPYAEDDPYRDDILAELRSRASATTTPGEYPPMPAESNAEPPPPEPPPILPPTEPPAIPDPSNPPTDPPPPPPPPAGTEGPVWTQTPGGAATATPAAVDPLRARLNAALMKALGTDPYAVSADDPSIRPAIDAYYRTRERALDRERSANAERMNATGGGGGALDAANERAFQGFGQDVGNYSGQAVLNELTSRKAYLENMSKVSLGLLTADQDAALRLQIANLQAEIDRQRLAQQESQFGRELDYKYDALPA